MYKLKVGFVTLIVACWILTEMRIAEDISFLTPEQQKALGVLNKHLASLPIVEKLISPPRDMFRTDYVAYTDSFRLRKDNLPTEPSWSWNQSNAKVTVKISETKTVAMQKMNPRRKKYVTTSPSYKIWIFIVSEKGKKDLEFVWCEKGISAFFYPTVLAAPSLSVGPSTQVVEDASPPPPLSPTIEEKESCYEEPSKCNSSLQIEDFAFLKDFTEWDIALELGWIN